MIYMNLTYRILTIFRVCKNKTHCLVFIIYLSTMKILDSIKILLAPYLAFILILVYFLTSDIKFLFLVGGFLFLFSVTFLLMISFTIVKFGYNSLLELEIEPIPWAIFFLTLMMYIYECSSLIFNT